MEKGIVIINGRRFKCLITDKLQTIKFMKKIKGKEYTITERRLNIYISKDFVADYYIIIPVPKDKLLIHDKNVVEII